MSDLDCTGKREGHGTDAPDGSRHVSVQNETDTNIQRLQTELAAAKGKRAAERREARRLADEAEHARERRFRTELESENGIPPDHPIAAGLYSYAWDEGHSSGFEEVRSHYGELVTRIVDPVRHMLGLTKAGAAS